jgi:hypothetical protein
MALKVFKPPGGEGGLRKPYLIPTDAEVERFTPACWHWGWPRLTSWPGRQVSAKRRLGNAELATPQHSKCRKRTQVSPKVVRHHSSPRSERIWRAFHLSWLLQWNFEIRE